MYVIFPPILHLYPTTTLSFSLTLPYLTFPLTVSHIIFRFFPPLSSFRQTSTISHPNCALSVCVWRFQFLLHIATRASFFSLALHCTAPSVSLLFAYGWLPHSQRFP
ncbi:hypothetical protein DM02DRAFT_79163 [Periconia macrospinosa]|uniref:Uncharacterized protein n=1 Tax=Periconia macrospinosa TaxID=97972 RepID=A0A2V1DHB1_9PLEO|nr:hypothetical protein DM02DRAFT_79163 [Periconia macrospinosa]